MDTNKPHATETTKAEQELLEALRADPLLANNLTHILSRYKSETNTGMDAHQAEMSIVEIVRDLGNRMLTQWGEQTQDEVARQHSADPNLVGHGKKTPLAQHLREYRNPPAGLPLQSRREDPTPLPSPSEADRLRLLAPAAS